MPLKDVPCPRCGKLMTQNTLGDHIYYFCVEISGEGCDSIFSANRNCYFNDIYIINRQGEIVGYKHWKGGKYIPTKTFIKDEYGKKVRY